MGDMFGTVPSSLASALARAGDIRIAIETGTFQGRGARALRPVFSKVYTIEVLPDVYAAAQARLADDQGIECRLGSSPEVLDGLLCELDEPVLFWLDAHGGMVYSPRGNDERTATPPAGTASECPLLEELAVIDAFGHAARSCVLIDDARAFLGPLPHRRREEWPRLVEVIDALRHAHQRYITVLGDVIIGVPLEHQEVVDRWWLDVLRERADARPSIRIAARGLGAALKRDVRARLPASASRRVRTPL